MITARRLRPLLPMVVLGAVAVRGLLRLAANASGPDPWKSRDVRVSFFVLALLFVPYALLSLESVVGRLRQIVDGRPITSLVLAASLLCPYSLYWGGPGNADPAALFELILFVVAASALALLWPRRTAKLLGDLLVVAAVWLPVEFRWLDRSFPWPPKGAGRILCGILALDLLLYLMLVVRRVDGTGYSFRLRRSDLPWILGAFALFAAVAVPIGLWSGFLVPPHGWPAPLDAAEKLVLIFLFTGIPEETLFRGFLQGILARGTGRALVALAGVSLLFGAAHLDNGPSPDWRYALLATLAGVAYGSVYLKTRRIMAPALTHALVDATWKLLFSR